jgi:hypothetical protein
MANLFYSISSLPISLADEGGNPNPLGGQITFGPASNPSATFEFRVNTSTGMTTMNIRQALERLKYFVRQRGFIAGSGGPSGSTAFSDATKTATVTSGSSSLTALSANVNTAGWKLGMSISGAGIPGSTTILAVSADGLQVFLSANATASATAVALTVTAASLPAGLLPV